MLKYFSRWACGLVLLAAPATAAWADELIRNGNFEHGAQDFRTAYRHSPGNVGDPGTYDVLKDPRAAHDSAAPFGDHTSGKGYLLMVNGATAAGAVVWEQSVDVVPGFEYTFSLWVASWYAGSPARLDIRINGESIGKVTAPGECGRWKEFRAKWYSSAEPKTVIQVINLNTDFSGNDFAIDDISLQGPAPPKR
jgi:hypothetical protein